MYLTFFIYITKKSYELYALLITMRIEFFISLRRTFTRGTIHLRIVYDRLCNDCYYLQTNMDIHSYIHTHTYIYKDILYK